MFDTPPLVKAVPTYESGEAFGQFAAVDLSSSDGKLYKAAASGRGDFIANTEAFAVGDKISVTPTNVIGIYRMVASGAIAAYAKVRLAGSGKVNDNSGGRVLGINVGGATTADGDYVQVLMGIGASDSGNTAGIKDVTADTTLTEADSGKIVANNGASGTVVATLPAAKVGLRFLFLVKAAQAFRLDPNGTETIALPSTGVQSAAGKYIWADAVGEFVEVECYEDGKWEVFGYRGTWTAEA